MKSELVHVCLFAHMAGAAKECCHDNQACHSWAKRFLAWPLVLEQCGFWETTYWYCTACIHIPFQPNAVALLARRGEWSPCPLNLTRSLVFRMAHTDTCNPAPAGTPLELRNWIGKPTCDQQRFRLPTPCLPAAGIVTVTTVGYGDITPTTWPAKVVSGCLCFISVPGQHLVLLPVAVVFLLFIFVFETTIR